MNRCEERTEEDIEVLFAWVQSMKIAFFQKIEPALLKHVCRVVKIMEYPKNSVVVKQGERGDTFFVIVHGSVSIYIKQDAEGEGDGEDGDKGSADSDAKHQKKPHRRRTSTVAHSAENSTSPLANSSSSSVSPAASASASSVASGVSTSSNEEQTNRRKSSASVRTGHGREPFGEYGVNVNTVHSGAGFGELALLSNVLRTATIITREHCVFLSVDKTNYNVAIKVMLMSCLLRYCALVYVRCAATTRRKGP